ncbi:F-box/FBD/LRR-repeat protein At1g13570-like isoform X2 [Apium graveolens]
MATASKTRRLDCGADRISNLPTLLLDAILIRLPVRDAARTSILSTTWRNIWGTHPNLIFDDNFFSQLVSKKDKQSQLFEAVKAVNDILLLHTGPVLNFLLFIPPDLPLNECIETDFWIKNISNNEVRNFKLLNAQEIPYTMPSYLFSCFKLNDLTLGYCILKPPLRFGGFFLLESVRLMKVIITADISFGPKLEQLIMECCIGIKHLGCLFKNHSNLSILIIYSGDIDWKLFECTQKVHLISLSLKKVTDPREKIVNLEGFVGSMPKMNNLLVDDLFLKSLKPASTIPEMLTTKMENLKYLYFAGVGFHDLVQIKYVLCLIRSSPNLQYLSMGPVCDEKLRTEAGVGLTYFVGAKNPIGNSRSGLDSEAVSKNSGKSVEKYLQLPIRDMLLDKLQTVDISGMVGSTAELRFIKLMLVSSPSLEIMSLGFSSATDEEVRSRISRELFQFNRCASTTVELIM